MEESCLGRICGDRMKVNDWSGPQDDIQDSLVWRRPPSYIRLCFTSDVHDSQYLQPNGPSL